MIFPEKVLFCDSSILSPPNIRLSEKTFRSEVFSYPSDFLDKDNFSFYYSCRKMPHDFSIYNYIEDGYAIRCYHCKQVYKIQFFPVLEKIKDEE